jgi:hypothetical protein
MSGGGRRPRQESHAEHGVWRAILNASAASVKDVSVTGGYVSFIASAVVMLRLALVDAGPRLAWWYNVKDPSHSLFHT